MPTSLPDYSYAILLNWRKEGGQPPPDPAATAAAQAAAKAQEAALARADRQRTDRLRGLWGQLSDAQRQAITAMVTAANPGIQRLPASFLEACCLDELERRHPAEPPESHRRE
jgi:hypothetical protein